jgi:membrane-associated protease RseP (regulator of RpoE activity)
MISPKHLWSGDWRGDSAAAAEELARRQSGLEDLPEPEPEPAPEPIPRRRLVRPRHLRAALLIAVLALAVAGAAYGLTSAFGTNKSRTPVNAQAYLGLQIGSRALMGGLLINSVSPGGPAEQAGVRAGDVLSRIGQIEVHTPGDVRALMQGRRPGDQVELGIERGNYKFTANVTLTARR